MSGLSEAITLAIESAVMGGSLSLFRGPSLVAERTGDGRVARAENLISDISECLDDVGLAISDIEALAVSVGPGSYTGVRIGIATVLGLRQGLNVPCHGVSVIEAVRLASDTAERKLCVLPMGRESYSIQHDMPDENAGIPSTVTLSGLRGLLNSVGDIEIIAHSRALEDLGDEYSYRRFIDAGRNLSRFVGMAVLNGHRSRDLTPIYASASR